MEYWAQISVLLGIIVTGFKIWFDYSLGKAKIKVEYVTKIQYEQYKIYINYFNIFNRDIRILKSELFKSNEKHRKESFTNTLESTNNFYLDILMTKKIFSKKIETELNVLREKVSNIIRILNDKMELQEAKSLQNETEILEKHKTVSTKFKQLHKQQELITNLMEVRQLMAKELSLR